MLDQTLLLLRNAIWMMRELELQTDPKSTDKKLQQHSACIDKMLSRWEGGGGGHGGRGNSGVIGRRVVDASKSLLCCCVYMR